MKYPARAAEPVPFVMPHAAGRTPEHNTHQPTLSAERKRHTHGQRTFRARTANTPSLGCTLIHNTGHRNVDRAAARTQHANSASFGLRATYRTRTLPVKPQLFSLRIEPLVMRCVSHGGNVPLMGEFLSSRCVSVKFACESVGNTQAHLVMMGNIMWFTLHAARILPPRGILGLRIEHK
jgi:hypothetical protein